MSELMRREGEGGRGRKERREERRYIGRGREDGREEVRKG